LKTAAGPLFFAVLAFLSLAGAYAMWPADFFSIPFSGMPGAMLLRAAAASILALGALEFLCALAIALQPDG